MSIRYNPAHPGGRESAYTVEVHVVPDDVHAPHRDYYIGHCWPASWPYMLGLLTIIGDAVRGVPWGGAATDHLALELHSTDDAREWARKFVQMFGGPERCGVIDEGLMIGWFANAMQTAIDHHRCGVDIPEDCTVIPTPTADGWINPADELPASGQDIWLWTADAGTYLEVMWSADIEHWRQVLAAGGTLTWRWMPFPPGVVPPPPADRDGGQ